ncbi:hypothetical protein GMLC_32290 [Geomonas limicola]|uniref:Uncharacterized protein n=1 Tax=Geomonas limicola TaxID=2740186 RepID=A0A6V8NB24_9BACT|nr:hypothetical protein GMLC_32290 [Geomonas limicola]
MFFFECINQKVERFCCNFWIIMLERHFYNIRFPYTRHFKMLPELLYGGIY